MAMVLNEASNDILESQRIPIGNYGHAKASEIMQTEFLQNIGRNLYNGLSTLDTDFNSPLIDTLKTFLKLPIKPLNTMISVVQDVVSIAEAPNEISHDQYTLVLENLFIGMTASCPRSLQVLPEIFSEPTDTLGDLYFDKFKSQFRAEKRHVRT